MAPRLPVRSVDTLRGQFPGRTPEELADILIEAASKASASVGAAVGAAMVLPVVPAAPVEIGVETLALVGIELKLIAELHEVYGMRPRGLEGRPHHGLPGLVGPPARGAAWPRAGWSSRSARRCGGGWSGG